MQTCYLTLLSLQRAILLAKGWLVCSEQSNFTHQPGLFQGIRKENGPVDRSGQSRQEMPVASSSSESWVVLIFTLITIMTITILITQSKKPFPEFLQTQKLIPYHKEKAL